MDWNKNEDVKFQYFCRGQSVALLTWIFMKNCECNYILEEEKDAIPLNIQIEESTNMSGDISVSHTPRKFLSPAGKRFEDILKTTQDTMSSRIQIVSNNGPESRVSNKNKNYHEIARTLKLTSQMQKDIASEDVNDLNDEESTSGKRRKRLKAALEKIEDGVMDSLGC